MKKISNRYCRLTNGNGKSWIFTFSVQCSAVVSPKFKTLNAGILPNPEEIKIGDGVTFNNIIAA